MAAPLCALYGVAKVVGHLALAIFHGIPKAFFDKGLSLKAYSFFLMRDVQETFGALVSLFWLSYGRYLVLEAQTQKSLYDLALNNMALSDAEKVSTSSDSLVNNSISNRVLESIKLFDSNPSLNKEELLAQYNEAIKAADSCLLPYVEYSYARMRLGRGSQAEMKRIAPEMKKRADLGNVNAQNRYALMLLQGHGVKKDYAEARYYYKEAAEKGDMDAQYNFGVMLSAGEGAPKDFDGALSFFKRAAENGHAIARFNYATLLRQMKQLELARENFKISADQGFMNAENTYAVMLHEGEGGDVDLNAARVYWKRAAEKGHLTAQYNYAVMCYKGEGGEIDFLEARCHIRQVVEFDNNKDAMALSHQLNLLLG